MPRWHVPYHVQYRNNAHRDAVAKLPSDPADRAQAERDLHSAGTSLYAAYQQLLAQFPDAASQSQVRQELAEGIARRSVQAGDPAPETKKKLCNVKEALCYVANIVITNMQDMYDHGELLFAIIDEGRKY